jgi:hypothetical protein
VLAHDLILALDRCLEHILGLGERLTQEAAIDKPRVQRSPVLQVVELVEELKLALLQVVVLLLIWSRHFRIGEVRNPVAAIEVLRLRDVTLARPLRLSKELLPSAVFERLINQIHGRGIHNC